MARRLAELLVTERVATRSCEHASGCWDSGDPDLPVQAVLAKHVSSGNAARGAASAVQLLASRAAQDGTPVARAYRDAVLVCDETAPDIADQVASARENPGVLGLRITTAWPPGNVERLRAGAYDRLLSTAEKHGAPVCVLGAGDLPDVAVVARAYPICRWSSSPRAQPATVHAGRRSPVARPRATPGTRRSSQCLRQAVRGTDPVRYAVPVPRYLAVPPAGTGRVRSRPLHVGDGPASGLRAPPRLRPSVEVSRLPLIRPGLHYLLDRDEFSEAEKRHCSAAPFARSWTGRPNRHPRGPRAPWLTVRQFTGRWRNEVGEPVSLGEVTTVSRSVRTVHFGTARCTHRMAGEAKDKYTVDGAGRRVWIWCGGDIDPGARPECDLGMCEDEP